MNIYLIGMMGSGKSAVADLLARHLQWKMEDVDELIVAHEGCNINDIFAHKGEPYFRQVEQAMLKKVAARTEVVVATGGGIVLNADNMQIMRASGKMIYLKASTDVLQVRLKGKSDRPLLKVAFPQDELDKIFHRRAGLYAKADYAIDTTEKGPEDVTAEIIQLL